MVHIYNPLAHDPHESNSGKCAVLAPWLVVQWLSMIETMDTAADGGFLGKPGKPFALFCASFCTFAATAARRCVEHPKNLRFWPGDCSM